MAEGHHAREVDPGYPTVAWEAVRLRDPRDAARLAGLREAVLARTDDARWVHRPLYTVGNFLTESWATDPEDRCRKGPLNHAFFDAPGARWYRLEVVHRGPADALGIHVHAGWNPEEEGWGPRFSYAVRGDSILGQGMQVAFASWRERRSESSVSVTPRAVDLLPGYELGPPDDTPRIHGGDDRIRAEPTASDADPARPFDADLAAIASSPDALLGHARIRHARLRAAIRETFAGGAVGRRITLPYRDDGLPPESYTVPVRFWERWKLELFARFELARDAHVLGRNRVRFHALLLELLPLDELWPLPSGDPP